MNRIRVLQMIDRPFLGGGQAIVLSLARGLDRDRFEVAVCSQGGGPLEDEVRKAGITFVPAPFGKKYSLGLTRSIAAILRSHRPDLVHTHGGIAGLYGRRAARNAGIRSVVHTLHGIHYLHYRNPILRRLFIGLERRCSRLTDAVVCVSQADLDAGRALRLARPEKFRLIRNGIDLAVLRSDEFLRRADELKFRFHFQPPVIGTVARLHRQKGVIYLLRAAAEILGPRAGGQIVVAGGGELEGELRREIRRSGLDRRIVILGERAEAQAILSLFDVFVLPSLWEGLPLVLIEAAALGKPIVATDVGGSREIITDGETGVLVPPADSHALAFAINRILDDPDLAARLGARARETIPARFGFEHMVGEYADLYVFLTARRL